MTRFLSWVQLHRRKRLDKMATNAEKVFHDGIEFSVTKLGNPNLELKKEQYDAIRAICLEKRDVLTVLPTGYCVANGFWEIALLSNDACDS